VTNHASDRYQIISCLYAPWPSAQRQRSYGSCRREAASLRRQSQTVPAKTTQLLIELNLAAEPIAGTVSQQPNGDPVPFSGWLQLTETIEAVRRSAGADPQ
jgi:hypothetical protein